ncbi:MAG: ABC transporter substrate-binding protein, partial [Pseudomonadota bacterium]
ETPAPTDNPLVRQAMIHAVDRKQLADRLWNGLATVPSGPTWSLYGDFHDEARSALPYDPERAKALLAEAGYDGEPIKLFITKGYYVNGDRAMEVALEMWKAVGLNVELSFVENWSQQQPFAEIQDAILISATMYIPDPVVLYWNYGLPSATLVRLGMVDLGDEFRAAGEVLEQSLDEAERQKAFATLLDIFQEQAGAMLLYRTMEIYGVRSDLEWTPYSQFWMDFRDHNVAFSE